MTTPRAHDGYYDGSGRPATAGPRLSVWTDPEQCDGRPPHSDAHTSNSRVRVPSGGGLGGIDWARVAQSEQTTPIVPDEERVAFCQTYTLRRLYDDRTYGLAAHRAARVAAGTLSRNTLARDRQALRLWARYAPRPPVWPASEPWEGRPLVAIDGAYCTAALTAMRGDLAAATVRSTWSHLRIVLTRAVEIRAIETAPRPEWPRASARSASGRGRRVEGRPRAVYSDAQLESIYAALTGAADLQTAFILSVNAGLRSVDLFGLRWGDVELDTDRPAVTFVATKTGKSQSVPLAPVAVAALRRWREGCDAPDADALIWPGLSGGDAADPERSRAARRRNARMIAALRRAGITEDRPWQRGRRTANERLERHREGAGQFVLGHARTLNARSYREPSELIRSAVATLPQPECFRELEGGPCSVDGRVAEQAGPVRPATPARSHGSRE